MITPEFHLHSSQGLILNDPSRFKVLDAGRRWGKSFLALIALCLEGLEYPEARLWYVGPTFRQSKQIAWVLLKKLLEGVDVKWNESELSALIRQTGSLIELKGSDNEDSLRGAGLGTKQHYGGLALVVDEFASIYDNWSVWHEVLRPMLSDHKSGAMFISTPKGKDAFWELFMKGQRSEDGWKSWQLPTVNNPYIDPEEIEEAKKTMPERYFRQEYEGSFEDFVGLIYPEFSENHHVVEPYFVQQVYPKLGVIDPALSGTTAGLKSYIDEAGYIVIYDEYYEKDKRVSEVCAEFKGEEEIKWLIDPASKAKSVEREGNLYSLYDEYHQYGITAETAENDVLGGINRVAEYFKTNQIKIFKNCTNLIWELERYHWTEPKETAKGEIKAEPYKKDDHLCDCLKYLVANRHDPADLTLLEEYNPLSAWGKVNDMRKRAKKRR